MDTEISFGLWLKKRRKALDLTRQDLAEKVGCSHSALCKIESDERRPSKQLAELLANALVIPFDERPTFVRIARRQRSLSELKSPRPLPDPSLIQPPQTFPVPIPTPLTPLIGRETEFSTLRQTLADPQCRLITLVGSGGVGKTRLAIEIAIEQNKEHRDAVFVSLASISSASLIARAIADALEFKFQDSGDPKTQLINHLREKKLLLVLDNFEHLLDGVGLLVEIIRLAVKVKILCTSREQLNVQGEWVFAVRGLDIPEAEVLFVNCARRIESDFVVKEDDRLTIRHICRLVEGIPLALELAATWIHILSLSEIEQEIQRNLDFLATNMRDLPEGHRSMQAVFDHSWGLLTKEEKQTLSRLSVFRGGFTFEATKQVTGASLAILSSLVSKSLVQRIAATRYDLHELLRQYSAAHLEADPETLVATREQHYAFYLALAEAAKRDLTGPRQSESLEWLEQEHDNLRAALDWALGRYDDRALQLAGELHWFWFVRGYFHEGCYWLLKALRSVREGSATDIRLRARALGGMALLTNALGDHSTARSMAEESVILFRELDDKHGLADALLLIGHTLLWQGYAAEGHSRLVEALAFYRETGDQYGVARTLSRLGSFLADWCGDPAGRTMLEESVAILQNLGDKYFIADVLVSLGIVSHASGEFDSAHVHFGQALAVARETGHVWGIADALTNLGCVSGTQGNHAVGQTYLEEALRIYQEQGRSIWRADPLCALAEIDIAKGDLSAARLRLQEASALAEKSDNRWLQTLSGYFLGLLAYYDGDLERAIMLLETAMALARESQYKPDLARALIALGRVMRAQGDASQAVALLREGLDLYHQLGHKLGIVIGFEGLAGLAVERNAIYSARLFGIAKAFRDSIGAPLPPIDRPLYENDVARARAQLGVEAFTEAWADGKVMSLDQAMAYVLEN